VILHIIRCEMCKSEFTFWPQQRPSERDLPDTWFTVFQGKDIQAQEGWHLCSVKCLRDWAAQCIIHHQEYPLPPPSLAHVGDVGPNERAYFEAQKPGNKL